MSKYCYTCQHLNLKWLLHIGIDLLESAAVATLVKACGTTNESDDRSPLVSHSNPGGAAFAYCILGVAFAKLRKRDFRRPLPRVG